MKVLFEDNYCNNIMENKEYNIINRLEDFVDLALCKQSISATHFLNPLEQSVAVKKLINISGIKYKIIGGYENSERNIIIIYTDNKYPEFNNYLALVKINFSKFDTKYIEHRMILGSVLSLGIKREGIGDIIIDDSIAYIVAEKKMAEYIHNHLLRIGNAHVSTEYIENLSSVNLNFKKSKTITGTVASLRIDSILALGLKVSRAKANELIKNQLIYVNWQLVSKATLLVEENQIISIRKKGRIILKSIGNISRKNRTWVELETYI